MGLLVYLLLGEARAVGTAFGREEDAAGATTSA